MADDPIEARPVESGEPSDLMAALAGGIAEAAAAAAASAVVGEALGKKIDGLETNVARATRRRTLLIVVAVLVAVLVLALGTAVTVLLAQGAGERREIARTLQEVRDCTTPDVPSPCQERIRAAQSGQGNVVADLKGDNIRASVAVGLCMQADDPDLLGCALAKVDELRAKADP